MTMDVAKIQNMLTHRHILLINSLVIIWELKTTKNYFCKIMAYIIMPLFGHVAIPSQSFYTEFTQVTT